MIKETMMATTTVNKPFVTMETLATAPAFEENSKAFDVPIAWLAEPKARPTVTSLSSWKSLIKKGLETAPTMPVSTTTATVMAVCSETPRMTVISFAIAVVTPRGYKASVMAPSRLSKWPSKTTVPTDVPTPTMLPIRMAS